MRSRNLAGLLAGPLGALALLTAGVAFVLADTGTGVISDTQCRSLLVGNSGSDVCDEAADHRLPWVVTSLLLAVALAVAAVVVLVRSRGQAAPDATTPARRTLVIAAVVLAASLALGWWGALRLGEGNHDYCGSPITGAGSIPYDDGKPADCADDYDRKLLQGLLALGGAVALIVVPSGAAATRRRERVGT